MLKAGDYFHCQWRDQQECSTTFCTFKGKCVLFYCIFHITILKTDLHDSDTRKSEIIADNGIRSGGFFYSEIRNLYQKNSNSTFFIIIIIHGMSIIM